MPVCSTPPLWSVLLGLAAGRLTRSAHPTTTLLVALTPGVFFLGAVLSPSGVEIAAAFATWVFAGAALSGKRWGRLDELAFAVSAGVLVLTRPIGAVLLLCILAITALAVGVRPTVMLVIARHRLTVIVGAVTAAFMAFWHLQVFSVHLGESVVAGDPKIGAIGVTKRGLRHLPELWEQHVGNFGWLDTPSPTVVVWFFVSVTGIVVATAWTSLTLRERIAIPTLIVVTVALSLYLDADYYRLFRNFGTQGRHLSPLLIGVPVLAARGWRPSTRTNVALASGWFLAMSWCAVEALRRYSVGDGGIWDMFTAPIWTPWLGVLPSVFLVIGSAATVAAASVGRPTRAHRSPDVQRSSHGETGRVHEHDDDAALGER